MKKIKDFIYDYNDIVLAILIIVVAGAIIFWKVSDIMAYPSFAKAQQEAKQQEQTIDMDDIDLTPIPVDTNVNPGTDEIGGEGSEGQTTPEVTPEVTPQPKVDKKFEVKSGDYFSTAAKNLKTAGLIEDSQAFIQTVKDLGLESKLQIGIFTIPAGATYEEIAHILTKTN